MGNEINVDTESDYKRSVFKLTLLGYLQISVR